MGERPSEPPLPTRGGLPQLTPEPEPQTATPGPTPLPSDPTAPPGPAPVIQPGSEPTPEPAPVTLRTPDEPDSASPPPTPPTLGVRPTAPTPPAPETAQLPEQSPELTPERAEMLELEGKILRDRETLKTLISQPRSPGDVFASNPEVREIAQRLPRMQAQLEELRREAAR